MIRQSTDGECRGWRYGGPCRRGWRRSGRRRGWRRSGWVRGATPVWVAAVALMLGGAGCGIRGTSVPVDAGPAPSRASCEAPAGRAAPDMAPDVPVTVFLVCSAQLKPVERSVRPAGGSAPAERLRVARALLDELRNPLTPEEESSGFVTEVPDGLAVSGPRRGDPDAALRLSRPPDELPAFALAQLVCTYADAAVADPGRTVLLGGPGDEPVRPYACTDDLKEHPEAAQTAGSPTGTVTARSQGAEPRPVRTTGR